MNLADNISYKKANSAKLKNLRKLINKKKERTDQKLFVVEGLKIIKDFFCKGHEIEQLYIAESFGKKDRESELLEKINPSKVYRVPDNKFSQISDLSTSQGILGLFALPETNKKIKEYPRGSIFILLDNVQDPGNVGAIIRTASAFSVDGLISYGDTADVFNPKVVRASSGCVLDMPFFHCSNSQLEKLKKSEFLIWASTSGEKSDSLEKLSKPRRSLILVFGNEGSGLSSEVMANADKTFTIRINKRIESLNVAVAAGISIFKITEGIDHEN